MTEDMATYTADCFVEALFRGARRDCDTCGRPKPGTQVCPMPKMDIDTCLGNQSRPFWRPIGGLMGDYVCPRAEQKNEPGTKFDNGKLRYDLLPPEVLAEVVEIFTDGAVKYGDRNWEQGMSWSRPFAAAQRHLWAFWSRQDTDLESGSPHLAHAIVNLMFLLAYHMRGAGTDDR